MCRLYSSFVQMSRYVYIPGGGGGGEVNGKVFHAADIYNYVLFTHLETRVG